MHAAEAAVAAAAQGQWALHAWDSPGCKGAQKYVDGIHTLKVWLLQLCLQHQAPSGSAGSWGGTAQLPPSCASRRTWLQLPPVHHLRLHPRVQTSLQVAAKPCTHLLKPSGQYQAVRPPLRRPPGGGGQ